MDLLIKDLIENLFGQGAYQKYFYISFIILLVGLPYLIRTWREIFSPKSYLEIRKLQLDILKAYSDLHQLVPPTKNEKVRKLADEIFNDPEINRAPSPVMFGGAKFDDWLYYLMNGFTFLFFFFLGIVVIWAPLLYMARHNWSDFFKFLVMMSSMFGPILLMRITEFNLKSVNAFSLGILSLPFGLITILLVNGIAWAIQNLLLTS